ALAEGEGRLPRGREDGRGEAHAHGAGAVDGALGDLGDLVEVVTAVGRRACGLVGEDEAGDAAAGLGLLRRRGEDVVGAEHRGRADGGGGGAGGGGGGGVAG